MEYEIFEYTLPSSWASYLIYGDCSGMDDDEIELVDRFTSDIVKEHGHAFFSCSGAASFCHCHDAWYLQPLAGDCLEYSLVVPKEDN